MPHGPPHWTDSLERVKHPDGRDLIGASFRGIPFFVESSNYSGGRRIVTHEFAQNDLPAHDDLGRKARTFGVTGYVLGPFYTTQRDNLLNALEDVSGASELIHPYFGPRRVRAGGVTVRESVTDGGIATFQIEFLDAPLSVSPGITEDLTAQVTSSADVAFIESAADFEETYDVDGQPSFATDSLADELTSLSQSLGSTLSLVVSLEQELALLDVSVQDITDNAAALVRAPEDIIDVFLDVVLQLTETLLNSPQEVVTALLDSYDVEPTIDVLGDTETRIQERANQLAISDTLRRALAIQASLMLPDIKFVSTEDATFLRERTVTALNELAETAGDTAYPSIVDLRSAVLRAVPGDAVLASIKTITRNVDLPALVISYQLYGNVELEQDIVDRNNVQHPAFVSGDIEVLTFV